VNDVGKPCAGELHARFEAVGTGNGMTATVPVPDPTQPMVSLFCQPLLMISVPEPLRTVRPPA
jgi:hypothetical protein